MESIYTISNTINKGFIGQISYTICLDHTYQDLNIECSFDKQYVLEVTPQMEEDFIKASDHRCNYADLNKKDLHKKIKSMKTEIHTQAFLNDVFIGGIHRQLPVRNMYFSSKQSSDGCLLVDEISGVLKITIIVFNVIYNDTSCILNVSATKINEKEPLCIVE